VPSPHLAFADRFRSPSLVKLTYMFRPFSTQGLKSDQIALEKSFNAHIPSPVLSLIQPRYKLGNVAMKDLSIDSLALGKMECGLLSFSMRSASWKLAVAANTGPSFWLSGEVE
jgi:hypothetical protein